MSYDDTNYGLTASGFYAGPIDFVHDERIEKKKELEHNTQLTKLTAHAVTPAHFISTCLNLVIHRLIDSAIKRYCEIESLPISMSLCRWDKKNFQIVIIQYLDALGVYLNPDKRTQLSELINELVLNERMDSVYERVGFLRAFVIDSSSNVQVDKKLMRRLLSSSRLFLSVMDLKGHEAEYLVKQRERNQALVDAEKILSLPSFRGKKFIKNWKVRHLRELMDYAHVGEKDAYFKLLDLQENESIDYLRAEANHIFMSHLPLI